MSLFIAYQPDDDDQIPMDHHYPMPVVMPRADERLAECGMCLGTGSIGETTCLCVYQQERLLRAAYEC